MITFIFGENSFEVEQKLALLTSEPDFLYEKINGLDLDLYGLVDIFSGASLFAGQRNIVIRNLSQNKPIWTKLADFLKKSKTDNNLLIVESAVDKRTATFKQLKSIAEVYEFQPWTERDFLKAEKWVITEAKSTGLVLSQNLAKQLVGRVGVDQWLLYHALQKLTLVETVDAEIIDEIIDLNPAENIFNLFETALKGDSQKIKQMISVLKQTEEPYRLASLLFSQAFQLIVARESSGNGDASKDFAIHPYALTNLNRLARNISSSKAKNIIDTFVEADCAMKSTQNEPWLLIERALVKIANY